MLMRKIHVYVEETVDEYINDLIKAQISEKIGHRPLSEDCINRTKRILPCSSITLMGRPCKYKRAKGSKLCKKHINKKKEQEKEQLLV